ncbi:MAG TPA: hypothetical protein VGH54_13385 [Mycobacterium sp.]|uniref:hypothetical protein n=1 Tax=Mycobacterium sp. TaxID=1785 RepID=UPI002F41A120
MLLMGCHATPQQCRAEHVAARLSGVQRDGTDWEAACPSCNHGGFRISQPDRTHYRSIWACACRRCRCDKGAIRSALLSLGVRPACLGSYALSAPAAPDPMAAAALREAVDLILSWPGLDPARMRLILAEARGDAFPEKYGDFARFAQGIGIGRRHSYNLAAEFCRPPDSSSCPEGEVVDTES